MWKYFQILTLELYQHARRFLTKKLVSSIIECFEGKEAYLRKLSIKNLVHMVKYMGSESEYISIYLKISVCVQCY